MPMLKNEDDKLFFCDFSGDRDVTWPTISVSKYKKITMCGMKLGMMSIYEKVSTGKAQQDLF